MLEKELYVLRPITNLYVIGLAEETAHLLFTQKDVAISEFLQMKQQYPIFPLQINSSMIRLFTFFFNERLNHGTTDALDVYHSRLAQVNFSLYCSSDLL